MRSLCCPPYVHLLMRECGHTPPLHPPPLLRDAETELGRVGSWERRRNDPSEASEPPAPEDD